MYFCRRFLGLVLTGLFVASLVASAGGPKELNKYTRSSSHDVHTKAKSIDRFEAAVVNHEGSPDTRNCGETFAAYGSDPSGSYYGPCWTDGSGYFYFEWTGGCLATSITYSGGTLDLTAYGFTEGFYFYGFEPGTSEDFSMSFDDGTTGASSATSDCATCEELGQVTCWDGTCADTEEDCPEEGDCGEGYVIDCVDLDCCPESWIGDGYADCEDQAYGCDLTCYDNDGGDCDAGGTTGTTGSDTCADCEFDWTAYGSECCDTAWDEYGIDCATLESNYGWDCSGCNCPGDNGGTTTTTTGGGECDAGYVPDCADDDCCPESWIGDGFEDCEDQAYGCDLTCYDNDGGDCPEACPYFTCWDGSCVDDEADCPEEPNVPAPTGVCAAGSELYGYPAVTVTWDIETVCGDGLCNGDETYENCPDDCNAPGECDEGYVTDCVDDDCCPESWIGDGFEDCEDQAYGCDLTCYDNDGGDCGGDTTTTTTTTGGGECDAGYVPDCVDDDCCPESWIGDGFEDCEDQAYGCDLTCYDNDGGDCGGDTTTGGTTGGTEACEACEFDWTAYGSECCDTAWDAFGIDCATLEANYGWDCSGCNCPGDADPVCGDGSCNGDETYETCPEDCDASGCSAGQVADCDESGECWTEGWIGDGYCDGTAQQYGADLCCYDLDGGDCTEEECAPARAETQDARQLPIKTKESSREGAPYRLSAVSMNDVKINPSTRIDGTALTFEVLEGANAGFVNTWTQSPPLGEFTVYGFSPDDYVCVTVVNLEGAASSEATGPVCALAGDLASEPDCTEGGGDPCDGQAAGDANNDGTLNVLDVVSIVNFILAGGDGLDDCSAGAADYNADGTVNVLDVVAIVNVILAGGGRAADATDATMNATENGVDISANGYIGGVQMTLSHDADFSIELTDNAYIAEYKTNGNSTTLIVINPEDESIFTSTGDFKVEEVLVTNSEEFINVTEANVEFSLSNAYPNPFNPTTTIELNLAEASYASVKVFNLKGEVVGVLMDGMVDASTYTMTWDASNLSSGVYMIRAEANGQIATQKVMLVK